MLIVEVNEKQTIEKALKVLKKKWDKTKAMKELRERKEFIPKSDRKRSAKSRAAYIQKKYRSEN
jgi:small subunit ribosomal protein S21